jgi:DNA-binding transcriptional regulator YiaG
MKEREVTTIIKHVDGGTGAVGSAIERSSLEQSDQVELTSVTTKLTPTELRKVREDLGVSRAVVQDATGLSSSVVWRSEHDDAKPIADEQRTTLVDLYSTWWEGGVPQRYTKPVKAEKATAATAPPVDVTKYVDFINEIYDGLTTAVAARKVKKAATKDLSTLLDKIANFQVG